MLPYTNEALYRAHRTELEREADMAWLAAQVPRAAAPRRRVAALAGLFLNRLGTHLARRAVASPA